jgi:hypothetical protein
MPVFVMEQVLNIYIITLYNSPISKAGMLLFVELQNYITALLRRNFHKGKRKYSENTKNRKVITRKQ